MTVRGKGSQMGRPRPRAGEGRRGVRESRKGDRGRAGVTHTSLPCYLWGTTHRGARRSDSTTCLVTPQLEFALARDGSDQVATMCTGVDWRVMAMLIVSVGLLLSERGCGQNASCRVRSCSAPVRSRPSIWWVSGSPESRVSWCLCS
jgi:hypothetical protein